MKHSIQTISSNNPAAGLLCKGLSLDSATQRIKSIIAMDNTVRTDREILIRICDVLEEKGLSHTQAYFCAYKVHDIASGEEDVLDQFIQEHL